LIVLVLAILNIRKLILLRSPLDSQKHTIWRATGGVTKPDHLESTVIDSFDRSKKSAVANESDST